MQQGTCTIEADIVEKLSCVKVFDCKDCDNILHYVFFLNTSVYTCASV